MRARRTTRGNMSTLRLSCLIALAPLLGTACGRSYDYDGSLVQQNYEFRHHGKCNAWATSPAAHQPYCASPTVDPVSPTLAAYSASVAPAFASVKDGPTDT